VRGSLLSFEASLGLTCQPSIAKGLLKGQADTLNSAFHLSYNMVCSCICCVCIVLLWMCMCVVFALSCCLTHSPRSLDIPLTCQILNLLRVEGINPEFMIERSFFQFQQQSCAHCCLPHGRSGQQSASPVIKNYFFTGRRTHRHTDTDTHTHIYTALA
jgi:hypothetical protein